MFLKNNGDIRFNMISRKSQLTGDSTSFSVAIAVSFSAAEISWSKLSTRFSEVVWVFISGSTGCGWDGGGSAGLLDEVLDTDGFFFLLFLWIWVTKSDDPLISLGKGDDDLLAECSVFIWRKNLQLCTTQQDYQKWNKFSWKKFPDMFISICLRIGLLVNYRIT